MLPNEVFALKCRAYYESIGLTVDERNGEFAHCPYPEGMGETGYYLLHNDHQHQGLLQSKDVGRICFFSGHAKKWLMSCYPIPEGYFELWDIYDEYTSLHGREQFTKVLAKLHSEKNEDGKSLHAIACGKRGAVATMERSLGLFDPKNAEKVREGNVRGCRKAANLKAKKIEVTNIATGERKVFASGREASRQLGVHQGNLVQCALGKRPTCQGFTARYV